MSKRAAGMGTKYGDPVKREPITAMVCDVCGVVMTGVTVYWDSNLGQVVCRCQQTLAATATPGTPAERSEGC